MTLRTFSYVLQSLSLAPAMAMASPSPSWWLGPQADDATAEAFADARLPTGAIDGLAYQHPSGKWKSRLGSVWVFYDLDAQAAAAATAADRVQTGLDRVQTGLDAVATADDRVQTGLDRVATGIDRSATNADWLSFDKRYLGPKASAPTLDNQGAALINGAEYWNTAQAKKYIWNGTIWEQATIAGSGFLATTGGTMTGQLLGAVGTAGAPGFSFAADANTGMWSPSGDVIAWSTGGSERVRLDASGRLGLGTAPTAMLDVAVATASNLIGARFAVNSGGYAVQNISGIQLYWNLSGGLTEGTLVYGNGTNAFMAFGHHNGTAYAERMRIDLNGQLLIGATSATATSLAVTKNLTGNTNAFGIRSNGVVQSDVTSLVFSVQSQLGTAAAAFALSGLYHFHASQGVLGAGSSVSEQHGYVVSPTLIGATSNFGFSVGNTAAITAGKTFYGFHSAVNTATGGGTTWQMYLDGTAQSFIKGNLGIGIVGPSAKLHVNDTAAVAGNYGMRVGNSGMTSAYGEFTIDSATGVIKLLASGATYPMAFNVNGSERMRLDTSGNLLVGQTTAPAATFGTKLAVNGAIQSSKGTDLGVSFPNGKVFTITGGSNGTSTVLEIEVITVQGYLKKTIFFSNQTGNWVAAEYNVVTAGTPATATVAGSGTGTVTVTIACTTSFTPYMKVNSLGGYTTLA